MPSPVSRCAHRRIGERVLHRGVEPCDHRSRGVPAGAQKPYHSDMCRPGTPASSTVGTSATCGLRAGDAIA